MASSPTHRIPLIRREPVSLAVPRSPAELTSDWLTETLRAGTRTGSLRVRAAGIEPIGHGTGLLCQLARVTLTYEPGTPAGPHTVVAKLAAANEDIRGMVGLFRFYEREVRFYEELAPSLSIAVPRCHWSAYDPESGDFALLLEDLGALRAGDQLAPGSPRDARLVADLLVELHARWWNDPSLDALTWLPPVDSEINTLGLGLYAQAWPSFLERLGDRLPREALEVGERLGSRSVALLEALARSPRTLCHGDVRLDNIFFGPGDDCPPTLLDWQIAGRGVGTYDLAYFMSQSFDPDVRRASERDILARYHDGLLDAGVRDYGFEQCLLDYRRSVLFGFVYPVIGGGLGDVANERGHALARVMAERSAAAILDWNAADLLPA